MSRKFLFSLICTLIVLVSGTVHILQIPTATKSKPVLETLVFPKSEKLEKQPSKKTQNQVEQKSYSEILKEVKKRSLTQNFRHFWALYEKSENITEIQYTIRAISNAFDWKKRERQKSVCNAFSQTLIKRLINEKHSDKKSILYNYQYSFNLNRDNRLYFSLSNHFRPGDKVAFNTRYWNRRRRGYDTKNVKFRLEKIILDENYQISSYKTIKSNTTGISEESVVISDSIPVGIYRLVVYTDYAVQERYFQANWLDAISKRDSEKIMVYCASYKDTVKAPYKVHFVSSKQKIFSRETDKKGLLALNFADKNESPAIIVEKDGHYAFINNVWGNYRNDTLLSSYSYTDRPIYRPGQKVYFKSIVRKVSNGSLLGAASAETVEIRYLNPEGKAIRTTTCTVDNWGHIVDSLELAPEAKQGGYYVQILNVKGNKVSFNQYNQQGASFTVEAYKKPQFKIEAKAKKESYATGDTIAITAKGEYFFGGALADQPLKIRWYKQEIYHSWGYRYNRYHFYPHGTKQFHKQEEVTLGKDGTYTTTYTPQADEESHFLIAEFILTDESRREIRKEVQVKVVNGGGFLFIKPNKWQYEIDEEASFEFTSIDLDGKGITEPINVRIKRGSVLKTDTTLTPNTEGMSYLKKAFNTKGTYTVEATIKRKNGSFITKSHRFTVVKAKYWNYEWEHITLSLDKKRYSIGDTATVTVKAGAKETDAILAIEGKNLIHYEVITIKDNAYECQFPITKEMGSVINVYLGYSAKSRFSSRSVRAETVDSTSLLKVTLSGTKDLKPGDTFKGSLSIKDHNGNPVFANFSVALVDEALFHIPLQQNPYQYNWYYYRNNQDKVTGILSMLSNYNNSINVNTRISAFNMQLLKRFAGIQLPNSSGIDDLDLSSPAGSGFGGGAKRSKAKAMLRKKEAKGSAMSFAAEEVQGYMDSPSPTYITDADGAMDKDIPKPRERSEFKDLGYWNSSVTTDKKGVAQLEFTMPDDLTKWRLLIVGSDGRKKLIDFRDSMVTKMDIMVKLEAPRVLVEGDSLVMTSVIHNYSKKNIKSTLGIKLKDDLSIASFKGKTKQSMTIKKGETERIDWPLVVKKSGTLTAYTEALSKMGSDAESREYPVLINGISRSVSSVGSLSDKKGKASISLKTPADGRPNSRNVTINYSPTMVQSMFESLNYLTGFPYGCVEQTMSRFMPNLYVAETMEKLNIKNDSLLNMIPEYTHKGLSRLEKFQHSDGGWGWWEHDKSDPRMTALVTYGLSFGLRSNHVDKGDKITMRAMLRRAKPRIFNFLKYGKRVNDDQKVNLAYSLLEERDLTKTWQYIKENVELRDTLSVKSVAQLAEIAHKLGKIKERDLLVKTIIKRAKSGVKGTYWSGSNTYRWYRQSEEATAQVINAFSYIGIENSKLDEAIFWLSQKKQKGYWVSTKTTAAVLNAMSTYLAKSEMSDPDFTATISLDGKVLKTFKVTKENAGEHSGVITLTEEQLKKSSKLSVSMDGKGKLFYSVVNKYVTKEKPIKAKSNGITLSRTYTKLDYVQNDKGEWEVKRVPFDGICKSGDEIEVSVSMECDDTYEHVMVEDFFPAGMEVLKKSQDWYNRWCGWWWRGYDNREARDDRMVFFMGWANRGKTTMTYLLRAETPGRFTALPTKAECMYEPEIGGNSNAMTVRINN